MPKGAVNWRRNRKYNDQKKKNKGTYNDDV